ncbi:CRISPR-associated RAMP protein Csx7 [Leptolyngbya sp. KIOST-1]|uniref:type III CRISPR-associated RAMP protein Csx7 n=1 Tax=Leptolyngbya sp. KIOST-1 TaxID=1229172 RepID=UPI00055D6A56|nr:CRISPR-associated RAMP protein Csx7 [Leptolyngbya sp. KIOST-1]
MFHIFKNRLEITGTLTTITALRISQGRSTEPIGSDLPVVKDSLGRPLIPGSSFKGAMRSRLEAFMRGIDPTLAKEPSELVSQAMNSHVKTLKEQHKDDDQALTKALDNLTDEVSKVFGTPWQASKFQVQDLMVEADTWFGQYQERDGVAIDRDTETASDGKLYDFQVVPAGTSFEFKAVVENADPWELGLLMVGLHQFEAQQIPLGGGKSRGLGVVSLELDEMIWVNPDGSEALVKYLEHLVNNQLQSYNKTAHEIQSLKREWSTALIHKLTQAVSAEKAHA